MESYLDKRTLEWPWGHLFLASEFWAPVFEQLPESSGLSICCTHIWINWVEIQKSEKAIEFVYGLNLAGVKVLFPEFQFFFPFTFTFTFYFFFEHQLSILFPVTVHRYRVQINLNPFSHVWAFNLTIKALTFCFHVKSSVLKIQQPETFENLSNSNFFISKP